MKAPKSKFKIGQTVYIPTFDGFSCSYENDKVTPYRGGMFGLHKCNVVGKICDGYSWSYFLEDEYYSKKRAIGKYEERDLYKSKEDASRYIQEDLKISLFYVEMNIPGSETLKKHEELINYLNKKEKK